MKTCTACNSRHTDQASYCMHCGMPLQSVPDGGSESNEATGSFQILLWSLVISLVISMVLFKAFHLPVFFIAGIIPLW